MHKWQIITLKLNYGIYDFNSIINTNGYDNELLEEPQLEKKPYLYLNNIKNNVKNSTIKSIDEISSKSKSKNKKYKKSEKNQVDKKNIANPMNINKESSSNSKNNKCKLNLKNKNKNLENFMLELNNQKEKLNKTQNNFNFNSKGEDTNEINENNNNKTFEEKYNNKIFPISSIIEPKLKQDNSLDNLIINNNKKEKLYQIEPNVLNNINDIDLSSHFDYNFNFDDNKSKSVDKNRNFHNFIGVPSKPWAYSYYRKEKSNNDDLMMKIKKRRPIMNKTERQELFNDLYNDSKKRKEKYKKLSMEKEAKFNSIYTFTPKIISNKMNEKYLKNMADSKFNTNTNASTLYGGGVNNTSLITTTNNNYSLLNNVRIDSNKNNQNSLGVVAEENKGEFPLDFMSRLAEYERIKKNNLEKIKNEIDINTKRNNNINKNKYSYIRIPNNHLLNNSENYFENRQKNIEKITQNMYEEQGITFQPKTNKSFNYKIKNNIIERNKEFMKDKQEKLEKYSNLKEKECTFKPKINNLSTISILNNKTGQQFNSSFKTEQNNNDVSKRLFEYQNKYKEKLEEKRSKFKKSYSFKPEISKNTDLILYNKKKMMNQIKENENNLINNAKDAYNYDFNNFNNDIKNNNNSNELLMKQMKLAELEGISKRINELSKENMIFTDEKASSQKMIDNKKISDKSKLIKEDNQIVYNGNSNSIVNNNFQINKKIDNNIINRNNKNTNLNNSNMNYRNNISKNQITNENSEKIMELAKNLIKEDLSVQQNSFGINETMNYYNNKSKESTNDFTNLMMHTNKDGKFNNENKVLFYKKNNYSQEYDFDNTKGNKRIMNLNYYDSLLK